MEGLIGISAFKPNSKLHLCVAHGHCLFDLLLPRPGKPAEGEARAAVPHPCLWPLCPPPSPRLSTVLPASFTTLYLTWLGNFKLLLLDFDSGPLLHKNTLPLFVILVCLPIKISSSGRGDGNRTVTDTTRQTVYEPLRRAAEPVLGVRGAPVPVDQGAREEKVSAPPRSVAADSSGFSGGYRHIVVLPSAGEEWADVRAVEKCKDLVHLLTPNRMDK
ncbi:hypothetical protein CRG98_002066 [Punica granatum]|uniref:Uncharacterized protein n=1 Tax=Punica granatum TaxID=22663 RepID=A0A2I0L9X0_PUNGR|nr:hypothetical protein CRG98_002066 [Punica granatum]